VSVSPDVVTARVHELELEGVRRRHAPDVDDDDVLVRQCDGDALASDDEAATAPEVEVETQGAAPRALIRSEVEARQSRRHPAPASELGEVVERRGSGRHEGR
jgi:hypothetical protein